MTSKFGNLAVMTYRPFKRPYSRFFTSKSNESLAQVRPHGLSKRELLDWNYTRCSWIGLYYGNISTLIELVGARDIIEIGVAYGYHAKYILSNNPDIQYTGIDPYIINYDNADTFPEDVSNLFDEPAQLAMESLYREVRFELREKFGSRGTLVRESSLTALPKFKDGNFDLLFLDGNHKYEFVIKELELGWDCLRPGGILCGDDYAWKGVQSAVDEFVARNHLSLHFISKSAKGYPTWFFQKRDPN